MRKVGIFALLFVWMAGATAQTPNFGAPGVPNSPYIPAGSPSYLFAPGYNGAACNDATDDTTAFNNLLTTLFNAGGGTIIVQGTCLIAGTVLFPNDGVNPPRQFPIRITGLGGSANGYWTAPKNAPSALDLQNNATIAKLDTRGAGILEIDHLALIDNSNDCATFIQTTNTTLLIHDNLFRGTASKASACNKGIYLGGATGTSGPINGSSTGVFQGYGTVISANWFSQMNTVVSFNTFANSVQMINNTVSQDSGGTNAVVITGSAGAMYIAGNLFEVTYYNYTYAIDHSLGDVLVGNANWDGPAAGNQNISGYNCGTNAGPMTILSAFENTNSANPFGNCSTVGGTLLANSTASGAFNSMTLGALTLANGGGITASGSLMPVTGSAAYWFTPSSDSVGDFRIYNAGQTIPALFVNTSSTKSSILVSAANLGIIVAGGATSLIEGSAVPVIASGGCTSPSVVNNSGTAGFTINVGTGCSGSQPLVLTLQAASHGWHCTARDTTTTSNPLQTGAPSTTSVTITNYALGGSTPVAWTASDIVEVSCMGY